jgi:hypothetical protein
MAKQGRIGPTRLVALGVAESMPKVRLKSLKPSNSSTVNPNAT